MALVLDLPVLYDDKHDASSVLHDAKFSVPPARQTFLHRPRVVDSLLGRPKSRRVPITVVAAPVGSGKTAAAAAAARSLGESAAAWCTLDAHDNDPFWFGHSILNAMLGAITKSGQNRMASLASLSSDPLDQAKQLATDGPDLVLVLDNVEQLNVASLGGTLARLTHHLPSTVSLLLLAHQDPDLPRRLRASDEVRELRASDIAFSEAEARALFAHNGVAIPDADVAALTAWTNGSAAALHLAVAAFHGNRNMTGLLADAREGERTVHDELMAEALAAQPPDIRTFLLQTSITDVLNADLAVAVTGCSRADATRRLGAVAAEDVFLEPIEGRPGWFRQQELFADLRRAILRHERSEDVEAAYGRAAGWFNANHYAERASKCAVAAHDWDLVAELVTDQWVAATLDGTRCEVDALPDLPGAAAARSDAHALAGAILQLEHGRPDAARDLLGTINRSTTRRGSRSELVTALLEVELACATGSSAQIDEGATAVFAWSMAEGDATGLVQRASGSALRALAEASLAEGDTQRAAEFLQEAITIGTATGADMTNARATSLLALVAALAGRIRLAAALNDELCESWELSQADAVHAVRALTTAVCAYHSDHLPAAQEAITDARTHMRDDASAETILYAVRARLAASLGDTDSAHRLLAHAAATDRSRLLLVLRDALGLDAPRVGGARSEDQPPGSSVAHPYAVVMDDIARAVRHYSDDEFDQAWPALERALAAAARHGYRRAFVDSGLAIGPVLGDYVAHPRPFRAMALQLLERVRAGDGPGNRATVEKLTERELTVLRYLPTMLSNREIAGEMFFSVNTVKTHVKSIYRKLDVARRRDAVERARALSLI